MQSVNFQEMLSKGSTSEIGEIDEILGGDASIVV